MNRLSGQCHCGNLELEFETQLLMAQLQVRADQCSFCRRHGARTTTDPNGRAVIRVRNPELLIRYRFGQATADFLVCKRCGIYLAAMVVASDGKAYATLNVNCFDRVDEFTQAASPVSYDGESSGERIARRIARWTPTQIEA